MWRHENTHRDADCIFSQTIPVGQAIHTLDFQGGMTLACHSQAVAGG